MTDYDPELINNHMNYLQVDNMLVVLQSALFEPVDWKVSEYYGTEYNSEKIDASLHEKLANIKLNDLLSLPERNLLLPESFLIHNTKSEIASTQPKIIHETPVIRLWHKLDDTFLVPKTNAFFEIRSSVAYSSVENCVLTRLYTDLLKDLINEFSYFADIAGLSFHLDNSIDGLILDVSGFNDKLDILLQEIVDKMAEFDVTEDNFVRVKNQLRKSLDGWFFDSPHSHAMYFMAALTQEKLYTNEQKLAILDKLTLEQLKSVYKQILGDCHIQGLVHGNTTEKVRFINKGSNQISKYPYQLPKSKSMSS
jgi:insulysin